MSKELPGPAPDDDQFFVYDNDVDAPANHAAFISFINALAIDSADEPGSTDDSEVSSFKRGTRRNRFDSIKSVDWGQEGSWLDSPYEDDDDDGGQRVKVPVPK